MAKAANLKNVANKLLLTVLKYIPFVCALNYLLNTIFAYYDIDTPIFSYFGSVSILTWIFIYIAAWAFRFCIYHRMFLYYIIVIDVINTFDYYIGIPISDFRLLMLHIIITGIFLFLILYFYVKHRKKAIKIGIR